MRNKVIGGFVGMIFVGGVYAVESMKIDLSGPPVEVSDPIPVASAAYVPASGGSDEECKALLQNIGQARIMSSDDARQLEKSYRAEFKAKCLPGE